jgi:hypothetical protein
VKLVTQSNIQIDLPRLQQEVETILSKFDFHETAQQIGFTHSSKAMTREEKLYDCVGSLWSWETNSYVREIDEFTIFNEAFRSSYIYEITERVKKWAPLPIGRVRLMNRAPRTCSSMHFDESVRYHIAVTTNQDSLYVFRNHGVFKIPSDGFLYEFNACEHHTVLNAGATHRIHLVFDSIDLDDE